MRAALRTRLERLEVTAEPKKPQLFRSGYLKTLPADYVGERHVFEERPGPAPLDAQEDDGITIHLIYRECAIPQSGRSRLGPDEDRCVND